MNKQEIFDNKNKPDFFQCHSICAGISKQQILNDFPFKEKITITDNCSNRFLFKKSLVKLSELMLLTGMISSKSNFWRKLKEKAIKYNDRSISEDTEINIGVPSIWHEIRLGKRFLEIIIPFKLNWIQLKWKSIKDRYNKKSHGVIEDESAN